MRLHATTAEIAPRKEEEALLTQLYSYLEAANIDWAVCGGHAIDLFTGRRSREHKDIDVAVFWDQRERLLGYLLRGPWRVFEPEGGLLREVTGLHDDFRRNDNLWCVDRQSAAYRIKREHGNFYQVATSRKRQDTLDFIEFLFNTRNVDRFIYKRNESVTHDNAIFRDSSGIPYLAPELVLLYKAGLVKAADSGLLTDTEAASNCRQDFRTALPLLSDGQKRWLARALSMAYPEGHEWMGFL